MMDLLEVSSFDLVIDRSKAGKAKAEYAKKKEDLKSPDNPNGTKLPMRNGGTLMVDGKPLRSNRGTTRPPWLGSEIWATFGPIRKKDAIDQAIADGFYWGDHVPEPSAIAAAIAQQDPEWAMFCNDHGLTYDGELQHNVSLLGHRVDFEDLSTSCLLYTSDAADE